jgi:hypothetical protein
MSDGEFPGESADVAASAVAPAHEIFMTPEVQAFMAQFPTDSYTPESIHTLATAVTSGSIEIVIAAARRLRDYLSLVDSPPIDHLFQEGICPVFVQILRQAQPNPDELQRLLQFEACWCVTNLASGTPDQTVRVADAGGIEAFTHIINISQDWALLEQAVWGLGNIAGDGAALRDRCLDRDIVSTIHRVMQYPNPPISIYRNVAWTISNLTRSAPQPSFDRVRPVLLLAAGFLRLADVDTVIDSLWAFSYISEGPDIERLLDLGILPQVVDLLLHPSYSVQGPALRITGNLVAGDDKLTTACINARFIPPLASLLTSPRRTLRKEAAWAVSNIAVGREAQIQLLFDQGLIQQTLDRLRPNAEYPDIRSELIWIVANICSKGSPAQHQRMFDMGVVDRMVDTLYIEDARTQIVTIEALNFLAHSYKENQGMIGYTGLNPVIAALQDPSTTSRLEQMQYSENKDLYDMVITFVDTWFVTTPVDGDDQVM